MIKQEVGVMKAMLSAPEGANFKVNWALQFLRGQGDTIGPTYSTAAPTGEGQSSQGPPPVERTVNGVQMANESVIRKAELYPAWQDRKNWFLEYLQSQQASLISR
jgi:hypothetical protein